MHDERRKKRPQYATGQLTNFVDITDVYIYNTDIKGMEQAPRLSINGS